MEKYTRDTAIPKRINVILDSSFVTNDEKNFIRTKRGEEICRVNIIANIVSVEKQGSITNFIIDDGTGMLTARFFEDQLAIKNLSIGKTVLIIGKIRVYNEIKYISPEIMKEVDPLWLKVRYIEVSSEVDTQSEGSKKVLEKEEIVVTKTHNNNLNTTSKKEPEPVLHKNNTVVEDEISNELGQEEELLPIQKINLLIKEMDTGGGVLIEEIIAKSTVNQTDKLIEAMLKKGDIYQNSPGKVKVL